MIAQISIEFISFIDAKCLIGRRFNDLVVQSDMKHWPFKVIQEEGGRPSLNSF